ncbi:amidohydrolase family protein [Candidatus Mycolicibacterium alkanivorans]|uniref:Amidohydrolase family protein n=1 Tax=Candidatus Mycolicibacterium alkanivorans TaxID=2954114 RepID=A0ABS9YTI0_9MYCO|nr:amidohydrolase family protein [Candidatus Mycolicibacterium alkanivorans]MCI4674520.1 amidohydrolase family protein [Candidatus Mycolicibacterium alkanivorans]
MADHDVFDAHFHVIDPRFPLVPSNGYLPEAFTVGDYLERIGGLGVTGGAVVSGSFQGFDQTYLKDALAQLGPSFVGVTQIPAHTSDDEIRDLDRAGVRAVRFNLYRGGSAPLADVDMLARRVHDVAGWHSEFYLDAADLADLEPTLAGLPRVSIDHLGMSDDTCGALLRLVEAGTVVKATGFGRMHVRDPESSMRNIIRTNPSALIFGTDLPSTRAPTPFRDTDVDRVAHAVGGEHAKAVLADNAHKLYRLGRN